MGSVARSKFSSKYGFIAAAASSAVGLGNIWRFPYLVDKYGGGAFIFVYLILALIFGLALMMTEVAIGKKTGKSCIDAFFTLSRRHRWIGYACIIAPIVIAGYFMVISGWIVKYTAMFAVDMNAVLADGYFDKFSGFALDGIGNNPLVWAIAFLVVCFIICMFRVEKGIERVSKIFMPFLFIILVVIMIFVLSQDGIGEGVKYYLIPDMKKIGPDTFVGALGQLFFSLSLGQGVLITYGSYAGDGIDYKKSLLSVGLCDMVVSIMAGMIIVPMVYVFSDSGMVGGAGLMFNVIPGILAQMHNGQIIGFLFFLFVTFAAVTSAIALVEVPVSALIDHYGMPRKKAALIIMAIVLTLTTVCCLGYGPLSFIRSDDVYILEAMDAVVNNFILPITELGICILVAYFLGTDTVIDTLKMNRKSILTKLYRPVMRYVAPVLIFLILVYGVLDTFGLHAF